MEISKNSGWYKVYAFAVRRIYYERRHIMLSGPINRCLFFRVIFLYLPLVYAAMIVAGVITVGFCWFAPGAMLYIAKVSIVFIVVFVIVMGGVYCTLAAKFTEPIREWFLAKKQKVCRIVKFKEEESNG